MRNWRTGEQRVTTFPGGASGGDVRTDGTAVVDSDGIRVVTPDGKVSRVSPQGFHPRWAGDRIVYEDRQRLMVIDPGAAPRPIGVPTRVIDAWDVDDRRVLWNANGCLLVTDVTAPPAGAPGPGPCSRTELSFEGPRASKLGRDRKVRVDMRCVAAPGACR